MLLRKGDEGAAVRSVQEMLAFLGFKVRSASLGAMAFAKLEADGRFGQDTESAVLDYQRSEGVLADGIVGPQTMRALEAAYIGRRLELDSPGPDALATEGTRFHLERMPADTFNGEGYSRVSLRADVAEAYTRVYETVHRHGGLLTSSGGIRNLNATVTRNRSALSYHYLGRALDLYIYSGMVDPNVDAYVLQHTKGRTFRVWARCAAREGEEVELPAKKTIKNIVTYSDRSGGGEVKGKFLDLTALFQANGFQPIPARRPFFDGGSMMSAEWWHFQWEKGLVEGHSTFGNELLRLYRHETVADTPPWNSRDRVYGVDWSSKSPIGSKQERSNYGG